MIFKKEYLKNDWLKKQDKKTLINIIKELGGFLSKIQRKPEPTPETKITGKVQLTLTDVKTGKQEITEHKNLIPTAGHVAIARRLINEAGVTNEAIITYGAVGTNNTAPTATDTTLGTEIFRKVLASTTRSGNIIYCRTFLTTAEGNGVLTEFGLFGEAATGAADSGTLFERVLISRTKTSAATLLIESIITIE